jgi:poly(3-hydroxybutyrate) depolymerase
MVARSTAKKKFGRSSCDAFLRSVSPVLIPANFLNAGALGEEAGFGSNPGNLRMFSYIPANQVHGAPLIVVLHGCKQKAASFASDAGWFALSDRYGLRGDCVASAKYRS